MSSKKHDYGARFFPGVTTIVPRRRLIEKSYVGGVGSNRHPSVPAAVFNRCVTHWKKLISGPSGPIRKTLPIRSRAQYPQSPLGAVIGPAWVMQFT